MTGVRPRRVPLGGCDCYLLALEDQMLRAGQGRHVGVTFLETGAGFSLQHLTRAAEQFAASHPLLGARLKRGLPGTIPRWITGAPANIEVCGHPENTDPHTLAESLLAGHWNGFLRFDFVPAAERTIILMSWSHLFFDARGVEMTLAEIAGLAAAPNSPPPPLRESWGAYAPTIKGLTHKFFAVRPFTDRYYELKRSHAAVIAPPPATLGRSKFRLLHFTADETAQINENARHTTGGIFLMPHFLAVVMRAHAAVFASRGDAPRPLQCAISAQVRKRGAKDPIFQNQISQLFFTLTPNEMKSLPHAALALQDQFMTMTKKKTDIAFLVMANWMRRLPAFAYRRFIRRTAGSHTSFYHAHTGAFLPNTSVFCDAPILNGWHIPAVSQPPGTGAFFSEKNGRLTMSFSWREGSVTPAETDLIFNRIRTDLLDANDAVS